jgi:hypothetical protein
MVKIKKTRMVEIRNFIILKKSSLARGLFIAESIYLRRNSIPTKITAKVTAAHGINLATFIAIIILLPLFR